MTEPGTADILTSDMDEASIKPLRVFDERTANYHIRTVVYENHTGVWLYHHTGRLLTHYVEAT